MSAPSPKTPATPSALPPPEYWASLRLAFPAPLVDQLQEQSGERHLEFTPENLVRPLQTALALLNRVADDGWLIRETRYECPSCHHDLPAEAASLPSCPECGAAFEENGGVIVHTVYVRHLSPTRSVEWVVAIHGMNTAGEWQETFSWTFSTTWGRSVPVAVYKYGIVIAGVIMIWRRRQMRRNLRAKLAALRDEARANGFNGRPDVIAHSFGTWLFGHLCQDELTLPLAERLHFGRVILTGCILRPDFDWKPLKDAGIVEDVLNHFGTADCVVPCAHATIFDSGPSGRRGFDGNEVLNIEARGCGHSSLLEIANLAHSYQTWWRPFLKLPRTELSSIPDRKDPATPWRQFPWPLRGTIFPFFTLPLVLAAAALLAGWLGVVIQQWRETLVATATYAAFGLAVLLALFVTWSGFRFLAGRLSRP